MIRRKNALFTHFHGKLAKLNNISCQMSPFLFNFLNNKIYQKQKKKIFSKKSSSGNN